MKYIIVTHIHLDHAGERDFLRECPQAKIVVHQKERAIWWTRAG